MMLKINVNKKDKSCATEVAQKQTDFKKCNDDITDKIKEFLLKDSTDFTLQDISDFQKIYEIYTADFFENSNKIISKLFSINKVLLQKNNEIPHHKNSDNEQKQVKLPKNFLGLESLINEIQEDGLSKSDEFLSKLLNGLEKVDFELDKNDFDIYAIYDLLSEILIQLENYDFTQQKYIYKKIAEIINQKNTDYTLVSPEDGGIIDLKFHKIISENGGQRIKRGLSYILLSRKNEEVLKYGQVKVG